jgi:hypothetical protein
MPSCHDAGHRCRVAATIPAYDVQLFMDNLDNPVDAIGLPIAANTGLLTLAGAMIRTCG